MSRLNAFVFAIFTLCMAFSSVLLASMAHDWIEKGYGLHPMVAMPLATLCLVLTVPVYLWLAMKDDSEIGDEDHVLHYFG